MKNIIKYLTLLLSSTLINLAIAQENPKWEDKVVSVSTEETEGSGVLIGETTVLTSCHTLVKARFAQVRTSSMKRSFYRVKAYLNEDTCILGAEAREDEMILPKVRVPLLDEKIKVIGIDKRGQKHIIEGKIINIKGGLIMTDAPWFVGISGGAIIGQDGALLGIAAFFAKYQGVQYYFGTNLYELQKQTPVKMSVLDFSEMSKIKLYKPVMEF